MRKRTLKLSSPKCATRGLQKPAKETAAHKLGLFSLQTKKATRFFTPFLFSACVNLSSVLEPMKHSFNPGDASGTTQWKIRPKKGKLLRRGLKWKLFCSAVAVTQLWDLPSKRVNPCVLGLGVLDTQGLNTATCSRLLCSSSSFGDGLRAHALSQGACFLVPAPGYIACSGTLRGPAERPHSTVSLSLELGVVLSCEAIQSLSRDSIFPSLASCLPVTPATLVNPSSLGSPSFPEASVKVAAGPTSVRVGSWEPGLTGASR